MILLSVVALGAYIPTRHENTHRWLFLFHRIECGMLTGSCALSFAPRNLRLVSQFVFRVYIIEEVGIVSSASAFLGRIVGHDKTYIEIDDFMGAVHVFV